MRDVMFALCSLAAVIAFCAAVRTVHQREPLWHLLSGGQIGLISMMILLVISNTTHSPTLDLVDIVYALGFIGYALYAWHAQNRLQTSSDSDRSG